MWSPIKFIVIYDTYIIYFVKIMQRKKKKFLVCIKIQKKFIFLNLCTKLSKCIKNYTSLYNLYH